MKRLAVRRVVDVIVSALGLAVWAPGLMAIAVAIALVDGRPVLFRQPRLGLGFCPFQICKFRTMLPPARGEERPGVTADGDPAITPLGGWLRRWKLDELPQLWNILRGEMSLFGPRPELPAVAAAHRQQYRDLLTVKPGLLDPATIEFAAESVLLPPGAEREPVYRDQILPQKLALSQAYLARRCWRSDLLLIPAAVRAIARSPRRRDDRSYATASARPGH